MLARRQKDIPMNLQQLRYARALAECGSFVQAAEQCAVTQPTLSNGIAQLESDLGQQLFARTTRTVRLTQAGEHLLPDITDILNAQAALMARARALSHPERRLIRIGMAMYTSYIMRRTQIYLTEEQGRLLESRSKATGSTVSQLIRTAVDSVYSRRRAMSKAQQVRLARSAAGSWKAFAETGEEYVERIRGSRRLARLHGVE